MIRRLGMLSMHMEGMEVVETGPDGSYRALLASKWFHPDWREQSLGLGVTRCPPDPENER